MGQFWSWLIQWLSVVKDTDSFHLFPGHPNWIGFCPPACPFMVSSVTSLLDDYSWIVSSVLPEGVLPQEIWGVGLCTSSLASTLPLKKVTWSDFSCHSSRSQGLSPVLVLRINLHLELKTISGSGVRFILPSSLPVHPSLSLLPRTPHFPGSSGSAACPALSPLAWKSPRV